MLGRLLGKWIFICVFAGVVNLVGSVRAARGPNVVIFLADDQGWGDLSATGNKNLSTPHIDSIARDGAVLERFFVCPLCAPSRAEFLTGRYHPRGGVRGVSTGLERLNLDERTIAQVFRAAGYATGAFGKWHNGTQWPYHPLARGFDEYYGFTSGHWGEYFDPPLDHNGKLVRGKGYITDDLTDHAIEFIEKNRERPFFCYVPFNAPHSPFAVPQEYWKRFENNPISMRGSLGEREEVDETRCVLAMCENIDSNVGRVLKRLEELKLAGETIVIYFSDNGPDSFRWNGGMKGKKASTDEGGVRAPFFIRWPGHIAAGLKVEQIAAAIDLLPTLTKMAGIEYKSEKRLDGIDISPLLAGRVFDWRDRMIFSHQNGRVSVRNQWYRLDDRGALFDMQQDPGQTKDISSQEPKIAAALTEAVRQWRPNVLGGQVQAKDDRPYPVGYREFPMTLLPARDGVPHGGVRRSAAAPNCSYFVNWTSRDDSMTWDVEVNTSGKYAVSIYYTCREGDEGSVVELSCNGSKLSGRVSKAWDPPLYTNQDTIPRPRGESQMKEFGQMELGEIELVKGRGMLTLRATEIPGKSVMDVRQMVLRLLEP